MNIPFNVGGGINGGAGGISPNTSSGAENGDFLGGGQGGQVTFNNNQGDKNNTPIYALIGVIAVGVILWLRK